VTVDLVVVGAGIVGAAVAEQARRRAADATVLLLDQGQAGSGSTRYSAALCPPVGATPGHRELVEHAERWYDDLYARDGTGSAAPTRRRLETYWVVRADEVDALGAEFVTAPPTPASAVDLARLRDAYPDLVVRPDEVVLRCDRTWAADPGATVRALTRRLAEGSSSACWEGVRVDDVQPDGDRYVVLTHTGQRLTARHVVLATGPWLADDPGAARAGWPLRVKKVAALHLAHRPPPTDPVVMFCAEDAFLLPLPEHGLTLFSFHCSTWDVRPSPGLLVDRAELAAARAVLAARSPRLAEVVAGGRAFCDGYLPQRLPATAVDPARPGVVLVGGCSGSGFRLAPALAERAVAGLDRFAQG